MLDHRSPSIAAFAIAAVFAGITLAQAPRADPKTTSATGAGVTGGVPSMGGVVPNRAELSSSAFTKLDASGRGHLTLDDVRHLEGFETHFRQADRNRDGRLNASEFDSAWATFSGAFK